MPPGPTDTLAEVYGRYRQALVAVAVNIVGCRHRAEDAVHDAFARLVQSQGRVIDPVAYCFQAVRNAALNAVRKNGVQKKALQLYLDARPASMNDTSLSSRDSGVDALAAALEMLPPDERELIVLKVHANLTYAQIGEIQGVPLKTVATRYRRMIEELRTKLEQVHEHEF
ncbi:MAG: sigma-70 family RNA polymerase sigma factor [Pirellulaceae bacterium]|nr:sigma-70 family RNA polymerase sigma factor [Pirellulaceae bacterium]